MGSDRISSSYVPVICKYQKDQIKYKRKRWTHPFPNYKSMGFFQTLKRANTVIRCRIWPNALNSSEILWLPWLSARMKKIQPKRKALEWQQHFPNNYHTGATLAMETRDLFRSGSKPGAVFPLPHTHFEGRTSGRRPNPIVQNERELTPVTD